MMKSEGFVDFFVDGGSWFLLMIICMFVVMVFCEIGCWVLCNCSRLVSYYFFCDVFLVFELNIEEW